MRDWKDRAREARKLRRNAKHGHQRAAWHVLADGNDINTVRREVSALEYLEALGKQYPYLKRKLQKASLSAVEMLARIAKIDSTAALQAAEALADGHHTVKTLTTKFKDAQQAFKATASPLPPPCLNRSDRQAIGKLLAGKVTVTDSPTSPLAPPVNHYARLDQETGPPQTIAIIIINSYHAPSHFRHRMNDWLWRAMAAAWVNDHVVLLLPSPDHVQEYRDALMQIEAMTNTGQEQKAVRRPSVHVLAVEAGHGPAPSQPPILRKRKVKP